MYQEKTSLGKNLVYSKGIKILTQTRCVQVSAIFVHHSRPFETSFILVLSATYLFVPIEKPEITRNS